MGMFDTYDNLPDNYVPDNRPSDKYPIEGSNQKLKPEKVYNAKGNFVGLRWSKGDTVDIQFPIQSPSYVEEDSIIYSNSGEGPDDSTVGYTSQKAYNLEDRCVWMCSGLVSPYYIWTEKSTFELPSSGTKEVYFTEDYAGKTVSIEIYNFRWESVYQSEVQASKEVTLSVDKELSDSLTEGIYYCKVKLIGEGGSTVVGKTMLAIV